MVVRTHSNLAVSLFFTCNDSSVNGLLREFSSTFCLPMATPDNSFDRQQENTYLLERKSCNHSVCLVHILDQKIEWVNIIKESHTAFPLYSFFSIMEVKGFSQDYKYQSKN